MSDFLTNVTALLKEKNITKNKLLTDLHLSRNSFVDWKRRGTVPSAKVVSAIAEYLGVTLSELMGVPDEDYLLESFKDKLTHQLTISCKTVDELSSYLRVPEETIMEWMDNKSSSYEKYYKELSNFFEVSEKYWKVPFSISPGIEPTMDEYMLILLYREYRETGQINDMYGSLEHYFPGISLRNNNNRIVSTSGADAEWLKLIHALPHDAQFEFKGELKGYIKALNHSCNDLEGLKEAK